MYGNYYGRRNSVFSVKAMACIGIIIAICCKNQRSEKTYIATVTDKDIKNDDPSSKILVFTKQEIKKPKYFQWKIH